MNIEEHLLFEGDLLDLAAKNKERMTEEVLGYSKDFVLSSDIEEVVGHLLNKYGLDVPVLKILCLEVLDPVEVTIVRKRVGAGDNRGHETVRIRGNKIESVVPFKGDSILFEYRVRVGNHRPIHGRIEGQELCLSYLMPLDFEEHHESEVANEFGRDTALISKYLERSSDEASRFNKELASSAKSLLDQRIHRPV